MISLLGWRYAYLVLGLSIMILLIPAILLFYAGDPSEKNLKPYGAEEDNDTDSTTDSKPKRRNGLCGKHSELISYG